MQKRKWGADCACLMLKSRFNFRNSLDQPPMGLAWNCCDFLIEKVDPDSRQATTGYRYWNDLGSSESLYLDSHLVLTFHTPNSLDSSDTNVWVFRKSSSSVLKSQTPRRWASWAKTTSSQPSSCWSGQLALAMLSPGVTCFNCCCQASSVSAAMVCCFLSGLGFRAINVSQQCQSPEKTAFDTSCIQHPLQLIITYHNLI